MSPASRQFAPNAQPFSPNPAQRDPIFWGAGAQQWGVSVECLKPHTGGGLGPEVNCVQTKVDALKLVE